MSFLHGLKIYENTDGGQVIPLQMSSVYGIVGTAAAYHGEEESADDFDAANAAFEEMFPLNKPVLVTKTSQVALMSKKSYLRQAIEMAWGEQKTHTVVVRVEGSNEDEEAVETVVYLTDHENNVITDGEGTPIVVSDSSESEIGDASAGSNPAQLTESEVAANIVGNAIDKTGIYALKSAKSVCNMAPTLLFAEIRDSFDADSKEAIEIALRTVAEPLLATYLFPKYGYEGEALKTSKNAYYLAQKVKVASYGVVDPCAVTAGLIAYVDYNEGQWNSPSNHKFKTVVGVEPAVEFDLMDESSEANFINNQNIACVVYEGGAYRLWGNNTAADVEKWRFLCVKRTSDMIKKTIAAGILWAQDKGIKRTFVEDVTASVNGVLNEIKLNGGILGGECWAEAEKNPASAIKQGIVHFKYKFGPVYPAQTLDFEEFVTDEYITEIFD